MGKVSIETSLRAENPKAKEIDIEVMSMTLKTYFEASSNVKKNGAIVSHPRTGAPIENPYLKIQAAQAAQLAKMRTIKSDVTVRALKAEAEKEAAAK